MEVIGAMCRSIIGCAINQIGNVMEMDLCVCVKVDSVNIWSRREDMLYIFYYFDFRGGKLKKKKTHRPRATDDEQHK